VPHPVSTSKPRRKYHKDPFEPDSADLARLVVEEYDPDNPSHVLDPSAADKRSGDLFEPCVSFPGIGHTGWNPPDPDVAVGPDHVVAVVNSSIAIFNKETGEKLLQSTGDFWFQNTDPPPPSYFIFDPKVAYDPNPGRFIILFLCTDDVSEASFLVSVSQTSDAMGDWYSYNLDATVNGDAPANTWPDYPGLGFDYDEAVYLTSNMWIFDGGFIHSKVRILDKDSLYTGGTLNWNDIWEIRYHNYSPAFTVKPACTYSDADGEFLLSNIWYGGNFTTYWKITDPNGFPELTIMPKVNIPTYSPPPNPVQQGGPPTLTTVGPMTQEVVYRNGMVYTAFAQTWNWGSGTVAAVRMLGIDTVSSTAEVDYVYGADGVHYFFPAIYADPQDRIHAVFSRSSESEYIGIHYVEDFENDPRSKLLKAGEAHHSGSSPTRWGDYGGLSPDPEDQNQVWFMHEYAGQSAYGWETWIGRIPSRIGKPSLNLPGNSEQVETPLELSWDLGLSADSYVLQVDTDSSFLLPVIETVVDTNAYLIDSLTDLTTYFWRVQGISECESKTWSDIWSFRVCDFVAGDADNSNVVNVTDVVFLIDYVFSEGPAPEPANRGDVNCDQALNVSDIVYLLAYVFGDGPEPCKSC
jgi:hypothetical protein